MSDEEVSYRRVFERSLAGLYRTTPDGRILECNDAFARMLGFDSAAEICQVNAKTLYFGDGAEREQNLARLRQAGALTSGEIRMRRRDGSSVWVLFSEQLEAGAVIEGTLIDITDRKEIELRLLKSERLAAVGTLAGSVAHEVNNPLAYALANVRYVLERLDDLEPSLVPGGEPVVPELKEALRDALHGGERVGRVVRDLQAHASKDVPAVTVVDIHRVLDAALTLLSSELRVRAQIALAYQEVPRVLGGEAQLRQAFLNLLAHVLRSMEGGPAVNELELGTVERQGSVVVELRSTGRATAEELTALMRDPFHRPADAADNGFELWVCNSVVRSLGGRIEVTELPGGRGTAIAVALPSAERPKDAVAPQRVLIIDDERPVITALERLLQGTEVVGFADPRQALTLLLTDRRFDLVLCDVIMPECAGPEVYRSILTLDPKLAERVVFMTGGAFTSEAEAFLATVPNPCLEKPFRVDALRELLRGRLSAAD